MNIQIKKFFSFLIAAVMLCSLFPQKVSATPLILDTVISYCDNLKVGVPLSGDAGILFILPDGGVYANPINPSDFDCFDLPAGLTAETAVRNSDLWVFLPISGTPLEALPLSALNARPSIPAANVVGATEDLVFRTVYLEVAKGDLTAASFTLSDNNATYDGAAKAVTVTPGSTYNDGDVTIFYEGTSGTTYTKSETAPTAVGTYAVTIDVAEGTNYNVASALSLGTLTIAKCNGAAVNGSPTVSGAPTHNSITVNTVTNAGTTGQTVEYAIDTANNTSVSLLTWQDGTTFNSLTDSTTYYVYARTKANANYDAGTYQVSSAIATGSAPIATFYIITFNPNGGSITSVPALTEVDGTLADLPTPTRSGSYRFSGWYTAQSGGTKVTTDTVFTANTELFAHWTYTGGSGDSSSGSSSTSSASATVIGDTVKPSPSTTNGTTAVTVKSDDLVKAADNAVKAAGSSGEAVVTIGFTAPENSTVTQVNLPKAGVSSLVNKEIDGLTVSDGKTTLRLDLKALETVGSKAAGDISVSISQVPEAKLTDAQEKAANGRPVFDFGIASVSAKITDFGGGRVHVAMPYTPAAGENPNAIVVYHLDGDGKLEIVENGVYDSETKTVRFTTTHFSMYVIGYNPMTFTDVPAAYWGKDAIEKAAARGLVQGVGDALYQPDRSVTRAEFVQMIANVLKLTEIKAETAPYTDVASGAWYYSAVMSAKSAGYLDKFTGEFKPNQPITREEMAAILAPVLKQHEIVAGAYAINLPEVYDDFDKMGEEYIDDIMVVTVSKLMQGMGDGTFSPDGVTTRAQAATVQIKLLELLNR